MIGRSGGGRKRKTTLVGGSRLAKKVVCRFFLLEKEVWFQECAFKRKSLDHLHELFPGQQC